MIPSGEKLIVKPKTVTDKYTKGGIYIPPDERKESAHTKAVVISVGPLAFEAEREHEKKYGRDVSSHVPKPGDTIMMAKYAGVLFEQNEEKFRVIRDEDVTAILERDDEREE